MQLERRESGGYIDAAVRVLAAAGRPLTAQAIADETVARSLIHPDGGAPDTAMCAVLTRHRHAGSSPSADGDERESARWTPLALLVLEETCYQAWV